VLPAIGDVQPEGPDGCAGPGFDEGAAGVYGESRLFSFVTLDAATKHVYRRTDSATLVALLPELRRLSKAAQKERERVTREQQAEPLNGDDKFSADLAAYEAIATERELWIRNELKRRGLLPLWPGEDEHLDHDA
jgi:hypothetical protein